MSVQVIYDAGWSNNHKSNHCNWQMHSYSLKIPHDIRDHSQSSTSLKKETHCKGQGSDAHGIISYQGSKWVFMKNSEKCVAGRRALPACVAHWFYLLSAVGRRAVLGPQGDQGAKPGNCRIFQHYESKNGKTKHTSIMRRMQE